MGSFYERLIGVVKNCIRKVLFKRKLTDDELATILTEVEMRINNRPLTYFDDDINHPQPLTPSHLIHGRRLRSLPVTEDKLRDPDYGCTHDHMNQRYSYLNQRLKHWEKIWKTEYLASLREKFYGAQDPDQKENIKVGDIVFVDAEGNRDTWPLGKITAIHPDRTGITRIVEVLSRGTTSLRTINKLISLELHVDPDTSTPTSPAHSGRKSGIR